LLKIIALATCYNRKELTLGSLAALKNQALPDGVDFKICLVDDGSTDGTFEQVSKLYPDVKLIKGGGDLFWCGGMRFGWEAWVSKQSYDAILVFNDDIVLFPNAINRLLQSAKSVSHHSSPFVVVGSFRDKASGKVSYGGVVKKYRIHPSRFKLMQPSGLNVVCDTLNMNLALISAGAIELIGFLSSDYKHHRADYDYGLRLNAAGGHVIIAEGYFGECDRESSERDNVMFEMPFYEGWKTLNSIKYASPHERAIFMKQHGGPLWPIFWTIPYVMFVFRWGRRQLSRRIFN
jgi:GT2 family glycosyltransferase